MNYKLKIHFLNDITTWRAHVPALITMDNIKSHFLYQCRLHSNGNGFKIFQKASLGLHQIFKKQTTLALHVNNLPLIWWSQPLFPFIYLLLSFIANASICWIPSNWWSDTFSL